MHSSMLSKTALVIALASIPMLGFAQQTQANPEGNPASATQKIVNPAGTRVEGSASSSVQPGSMDAYAQAKAQCDAGPAAERQACLSSVEMQYGQTQSSGAASSTSPSSGAVPGGASVESSTALPPASTSQESSVRSSTHVESSTALPPSSTTHESGSVQSGSVQSSTHIESSTAAPASPSQEIGVHGSAGARLPSGGALQGGTSATISTPSECSGSAAITTESSGTTAAPAKCELLEGQARTDCLRSSAPGR